MKKYLFLFLFLSTTIVAQTGIGTTTPVNKLEVVTTKADPATSGTSANGNLRLGPSSGSHVLDFGLSSSSNYSWLQARDRGNYATLYDLAFNPNGGKVGIGTSVPTSTLTVGNSGGTIPGEILLNPTTNLYEGGQLIIKKSLQGSTVDWTIDQYGSTSANARFRIFNGASESNGIAILENGKIGMGLPDPLTLLHLQNSNSMGTGDPGNNVLPSIYLYNTNSASTTAHSILTLRTNGTGGGNPYLSFDINGIRGYSMGIDNADGDKFKISNNWSFGSLNSPIITFEDTKVGIGTASPTRRLHLQSSDNTSVYIESTTSDNNGMMVLNANTNQNWGNGYHEFIMFQRQGTTIGQITAPNESSVNYATTSDYRLKKDLKPFKGLELINRLKTYDFAWKINDSRMYGFMAHELQDVLPYLVTGQKDAVDATGKVIPQTVDYSKLTPVLVKAIQEQDETINNLKKDKQQLEQTLKDIQERLLKLENKK
jgi:Chaperone of endosialidase